MSVWIARSAVERALDDKNMLHKELAQAMGIHRSTWSQVLHNHYPASVLIRRKLVEVLGKNKAFFWNDADEKPEELIPEVSETPPPSEATP
jgi:transcriptional regulator with XRE-family HTH domain